MDLMELLKTRRSFRRFDQSRPVPDSVIQKIARAQQYASCSGNSQSLRYIMVSDPALVEEIFALTRWAAKLPPEDGQPKPGEHPTLFAVVMIDKAAQNDWTPMDAGIAMNNMTLAAWEEGLGSCILGILAHAVRAELHRTVDQLAQGFRHGLQGELGVHLAFGTAQVSHQDHCGSLVQQVV